MGRAEAFLFRATAIAGTAAVAPACAQDPADQSVAEAGVMSGDASVEGLAPDTGPLDADADADVFGGSAGDVYGLAPDTRPPNADADADVFGGSAGDVYGVAPDTRPPNADADADVFGGSAGDVYGVAPDTGRPDATMDADATREDAERVDSPED